MARGCRVPRCKRPHYALGLCDMHWQRQRTYGNLFVRYGADTFTTRPTPHDHLDPELHRMPSDARRAQRYFDQNMAQAESWLAEWRPDDEYRRCVAEWRGDTQTLAAD